VSYINIYLCYTQAALLIYLEAKDFKFTLTCQILIEDFNIFHEISAHL
jgi:hypothetical protein